MKLKSHAHINNLGLIPKKNNLGFQILKFFF